MFSLYSDTLACGNIVPTFYFHVADQSGTIVNDEEGTDLPDSAAALGRAEQTGRRFLDKEVSAGGLPLDDLAKLTIEVRDGSGQIICTVPLSEVMMAAPELTASAQAATEQPLA